MSDGGFGTAMDAENDANAENGNMETDEKTEEERMEEERLRLEEEEEQRKEEEEKRRLQKIWEEETRERQDYKELIQANLDEPVVFEFIKMFTEGIFKYEEIDDRAKQAMCDLTARQGVQFLKVLGMRDLQHVANKSAYICGQLKVFKFYIQNRASIFNGPDPVKVKELLDSTGYPLEITTGQRRYGPPPDWEDEPPTHREISISKLPDDYYEDTMVPILSKFGKIYELRVMIDNITGLTRNFCFVRYCYPEDSTAALSKIDDYELEDGRTLKANFSSSNNKIFVGNLPKEKSSEELRAVLEEHAPGIQGCEVYVSEENAKKGHKNRGFCFLEYKDHTAAAQARRLLSGIGPKIYDGNKVIVEWAEPQYEPNTEELAKVKSVYVGNLCSEVNEDMLRRTFEEFGKLFHVQKVRDYAFIHFEDRRDALKAIEATDGLDLCGYNIRCSLSKSGTLKRKIKRKNDAKKLRGEFAKPGPRRKDGERLSGGGRFGRGGFRPGFRQGGGGGYRQQGGGGRYGGGGGGGGGSRWGGGGGGGGRYGGDGYGRDRYGGGGGGGGWGDRDRYGGRDRYGDRDRYGGGGYGGGGMKRKYDYGGGGGGGGNYKQQRRY